MKKYKYLYESDGYQITRFSAHTNKIATLRRKGADKNTRERISRDDFERLQRLNASKGIVSVFKFID